MMDTPQLWIDLFGPIGATIVLGIAAMRAVWPVWQRHMERRTAAAEKQAEAFVQIGELVRQVHRQMAEVQTHIGTIQQDIASLYEHRKQSRPSRRTSRLILPDGAK